MGGGNKISCKMSNLHSEYLMTAYLYFHFFIIYFNGAAIHGEYNIYVLFVFQLL